MTLRVTSVTSLTPTATANATDLVDATYPFLLQGATSTQKNFIHEVMFTGLAAASAPTIMVLGLDSVVAVTNSLGATQDDCALDSSVAVLAAPALVGNTNTTKPRRGAGLHLMNLSFNAFGGSIRYVAAPRMSPAIYGNSPNNGEISVSAFTGGTPGLMGAHMIYETM